NGIGVSGVAQDVRIMAMKFLTSDGWGTTDAAIECIEYADMMGADIMSNSWGGGPFEQALADAIANTDALFVAAAGNDSSNTDTMPNYPSCYDSPNVVAIGATNHNDEPTWFTNYGAETVDVFAPGEEILSTVLGPAPRFTPDISSQTPVSDCSSLAGWDVSAYNNAPWALSNTEFVSAPSSFALFDYGDYEDAWIKSTTPLDLSLMSGAMLRFQAYYDTEEGLDSLFGWGSTDGVTWSQLGSLSGYSGGFAPQTFDLSGFSGASSVYIAFSFASDGSVSSGHGFSGVAVDDIELVETDPLFTDRFDSLANWSTTNFAQRAWTLSTTRKVSAPSSAANVNYRNNEDAWLTLNAPIDMSSVTGGAALGCNLFYEIEPGADYLRSMASSDGVTWQPVASFTGFSSWMGGGFTRATIDLSAFAGVPSVNIAFQLVSDSMFSSDVGLVGVAVDDVSVVTGTWTEADYSNAYATMSGTSMATPHAAGIAALALSQWPDLDAPTLKKALILGADPIDALDGMCVSGGRANAYNSIQDMFGPTITNDAVSEYASRATITLQASDPNGVEWIAYAFDGDEPTFVHTATAVAVNSIPGNRTLSYWAQDGLGNVTEQADISFHITRGTPTSKSVAGADRFATAVKASQMSFPEGTETVVIATGRNWPDALGGTALAGAVDGPMLLCDSTTLPASTAAELERLGATSVYLLGGTRAVSTAVADGIEDVVGDGSVTRISGADRYATARMVADQVIFLEGPAYDGMAFVA
ncbi:MAG: S8 family serine peptidase, partial [Actinomycetota bacterium]|nr:S8 family serine peptidase [Actinomycetota bacterium]